jgi:hypothetical protein
LSILRKSNRIREECFQEGFSPDLVIFEIFAENNDNPLPESTISPIGGCEYDYCAGIFKQSAGARNRVGIGLLYRPARLDRLAELILWNRFLGSLKVKKFGLWSLCHI